MACFVEITMWNVAYDMYQWFAETLAWRPRTVRKLITGLKHTETFMLTLTTSHNRVTIKHINLRVYSTLQAGAPGVNPHRHVNSQKKALASRSL